MNTIKKGNRRKIFLSNIFSEHPVSSQLSFNMNFLIRFAILEEKIFTKLSFLLFLIPPTKYKLLSAKYSLTRFGMSAGLF